MAKRLIPGPTFIDELRADLIQSIVGQDYAIERFCNSIPAIFAGLKEGHNPHVILLGGPPDTGKTRFYEVVSASLTRTLGCPTGVIVVNPDGIGIPGEISQDYRRPSIFLLENVENLNPELVAKMLAFDFGFSIIIMTTNVGGKEVMDLYENVTPPGQYL